MKNSSPKKMIGVEPGRVSVYWTNHGYYSSETFATIPEAVAYARSKGPSASFSRDGQFLGSWDAIGGVRIERAFDAEYYGIAKATLGANWGGAR